VADERPNPSLPGRYNENWGAKGPKQPPIVQYKKVMETEEGVRILTDLIVSYLSCLKPNTGSDNILAPPPEQRRKGFAFVDGTPYDDPEHTRRLLERIAFIRITHYGGFYDFTADLAMADTAYTNISLPAHTDTTYFDDPAGLQAFHMLSHEPDATSKDANSLGGESLLVDGFNAALMLKKAAPWAYEILSEVPLPWHASGNKGIAITPERTYPVFELSDNGKRLVRVRWNNDDRGAVPFHPKHSPNDWYEAASRWNELLEDEKLQYWEQLKPGRTLIFDNWRVLHGRNAFTGKRRICGAYINRNDFMSRWRTLNRTPEEVNRVVIG
jgi:trimethyllysine dioxygenase